MASRRPSPVRLLCLSGPSLHLLGRREPDIYGTETLDAIHQRVAERARSLGASVDCRQSNHEGTLIDWIGEASGAFEGILLNAGAYSHTSLALADALRAVRLPAVEVHLSNPEAREPFRVKEVVGEAGTSDDAYQMFRLLKPDVVLMDISLPGASGIEAARRMLALDGRARVLMFSMHAQPAFARQALEAAAIGFLTKDTEPDALVQAVLAAAQGRPGR